MTDINLLPRFHAITTRWLIFTIASIFIVFLLHKHCQAILLEKQHKIILLTREIQAINTELAKPQQKTPINLYTDNQIPVQLFALLNQLPHSMLPGLYLTTLSMAKNRLKLTGYAEKTEFIEKWITALTGSSFHAAITEMSNKEAANTAAAIKFCLVVMPRNKIVQHRST